jgi:ACS family hexuronate transporter-like MFS transporter
MSIVQEHCPPVAVRPPSQRWLICGLLFVATLMNYFDRQILSLLKPILDDQFQWTNWQFGLINSAFQGAYAVAFVGWGALMDRFPLKITFALSIGLWSLAAGGHALVISVAGFLVMRVFLGLGEGGCFPGAIKAVGDWFPAKERSLATSLFNSGANVASVLAPLLIPAIAIAWGWPASFVLPSVAGLLLACIWLGFYRPASKEKIVAAEETGGRLSWFQLLRVRQVWGFIVAKFLTDPVWWFLLIWLPDYFNKTRGLPLRESWVYLVSIYAMITVLSIAGGWVTGYLIGRGWSVTRARKTGMCAFALLVVPICFVSFAGNWLAVLLIGLAGSAHQAWSANLFSTVSDIFPQKSVASIVGIGGMAGAIGGMLFPLLCGLILDWYPSVGYAILFAACGLAYLVAFGLNHLLSPSFEPIRLLKENR